MISSIGILSSIRTPDECKPYKRDERAACQMVYRLHNDDLIWDSTSFGREYRFKSIATAAWRAYDTRKDINPFLLKALKDPDRFAIAHVLLVHRIGIGCADKMTEFCGLTVRTDGGNGVSYEGEEKLYKFWEARLPEK